jgi:hypothetical protein
MSPATRLLGSDPVQVVEGQAGRLPVLALRKRTFAHADAPVPNPSVLCCKRLLRLLVEWQQVCAMEPYRTIFDVWCSDPMLSAIW